MIQRFLIKKLNEEELYHLQKFFNADKVQIKKIYEDIKRNSKESIDEEIYFFNYRGNIFLIHNYSFFKDNFSILEVGKISYNLEFPFFLEIFCSIAKEFRYENFIV